MKKRAEGHAWGVFAMLLFLLLFHFFPVLGLGINHFYDLAGIGQISAVGFVGSIFQEKT